jgi:hypothetical protein
VIELKYSLVMEATADLTFFAVYSPDLEAGVLGDIPEELPIPEGIPDEVKKRLEGLIPPTHPVPTWGRP